MYILAFVAILITLMIIKINSAKKKAGIRSWVKSQDLDGHGTRVYLNFETGISAKPDVVERTRVIEYKSAAAGDKPRWSDLLQVTAEMIATGRKEGELRYGNNKRFQLQRDSAKIRHLTREVLRIAERMRWHLLSHIPPKGTPTMNKCANCTYKDDCSDAKK